MDIYELRLTVPGWVYAETDFKQNKIHKKKLESLTGIEQKLNYFNSNICSLSTYTMETQIYFEWGNPDQVIKVFCNCNNCRKLPDFNINDEKTYFRLRDKEVKRIVKAIDSKATYKAKLDFILSTKGYHPDHTINVYPNISFDPSKDSDREMFFKKPVISLRPVTKEEKEIYNGFVKAAFENHYKIGNEFSEYYNGFDFEKEKARLNFSLAKGIEPGNLLQYLKNKIETHFEYPACIEDEEKKSEMHILKDIYKNKVESYGYIPFMFSKMAGGIPISFDENILNPRTFLELTHTEQIVKFYRYVKDLIEGKEPQSHAKKGKGKAELFIPLSFQDLFINPELIEDCLNLLKEMDNPCINDENKFIRHKGAFIIWFNAMEYKRMFRGSFKNYNEKTKTLNKNFEGLNISESLFKQENKRAKELYKSHFESEISALKH
ncbi:MAG: hypothetical protein ABI359_07045 [Ginsengibacter sp.]